jgi:ATP-binding cassette subfamily C (CFTR/MRP) protein 10
MLFFNAGLIGLAISYALAVTGLLSAAVNAFTETEKEMIAVERAYQYIDRVEPEICREIIAPPYAWPGQGVVTFTNVVFKYRCVLPLFCEPFQSYSVLLLPFRYFIGLILRD